MNSRCGYVLGSASNNNQQTPTDVNVNVGALTTNIGTCSFQAKPIFVSDEAVPISLKNVQDVEFIHCKLPLMSGPIKKESRYNNTYTYIFNLSQVSGEVFKNISILSPFVESVSLLNNNINNPLVKWLPNNLITISNSTKVSWPVDTICPTKLGNNTNLKLMVVLNYEVNTSPDVIVDVGHIAESASKVWLYTHDIFVDLASYRIFWKQSQPVSSGLAPNVVAQLNSTPITEQDSYSQQLAYDEYKKSIA